MGSPDIALLPAAVPGTPEWIEPSFHITVGRDPLGIATITTDRIIPRLVPGILALSVRARYFAFYAFLLKAYSDLERAASNQSLSTFIKLREYEYALAVQLCPNGCGATASGAVGKNRSEPAASSSAQEFERRESVDSFLGGYGLYYRSPMVDLGLVAPRGTALGNTSTPIDVLRREDRAMGLAAAFGRSIESTRYCREFMTGVEPVPRDVLRELSEQACLCRLSDCPEERHLIRSVLLDPSPHEAEHRLRQRRQSIAFFLRLLASDPRVAQSDSAHRAAIWSVFEPLAASRSRSADTAAAWAALVAKEYMQEGLSCIWADICRQGGQLQSAEGMTRDEVTNLLRTGLIHQPVITSPHRSIACLPDCATNSYADTVASAFAESELEQVRSWAVQQNTAIAGLSLLLLNHRRVRELNPAQPGWARVSSMHGEKQPGLRRFNNWLDNHLTSDPALADTMEAVATRFVLRPHESIAYSKLPNFTFRFRWDTGRLCFYRKLDNGRFGLRDIRRNALSRLSEDLGLWSQHGSTVELTPAGHELVADALGRS